MEEGGGGGGGGGDLDAINQAMQPQNIYRKYSIILVDS